MTAPFDRHRRRPSADGSFLTPLSCLGYVCAVLRLRDALALLDFWETACYNANTHTLVHTAHTHNTWLTQTHRVYPKHTNTQSTHTHSSYAQLTHERSHKAHTLHTHTVRAHTQANYTKHTHKTYTKPAQSSQPAHIYQA